MFFVFSALFLNIFFFGGFASGYYAHLDTLDHRTGKNLKMFYQVLTVPNLALDYSVLKANSYGALIPTGRQAD